MPSAARTSVACDIAGILPGKLNALIASGEYPCPPSTAAGSTRIFEIDDIAALVIFTRLMAQGFKSRLAGRFACKVRDLARSNPAQDRVTFAWNMNGQVSAVSPDSDLQSGRISGGEIMFAATFDLRNVREFVERKLQDAARIIGAD